jgi:transketolase
MEIKKSEIKRWAAMGSRATFGMGILKLYEEEPDFLVMSADLGSSSGLARFYTKYPEAFVNVGIAEQNMIGVASGLAKEGTPVFATSFAPFISMRASEQIRMNLGYMHLNVKAVGLGSGLAMGTLGSSHFGLEDIAVMRTIPGMTILCPSDGLQIVKCIEAAKHHIGPVYIRLTGGTDIIYGEDFAYEIGRSITLKKGKDIALIATGSIVSQTLKAAAILEAQGILCTVIDMHTVKPLDIGTLESLSDYKLIVTVEEHTVIGGLGSAVAEYYACRDRRPRQLIVGIDDFYPHPGSYAYLLDECGLAPEKIAEKVMGVYVKG